MKEQLTDKMLQYLASIEQVMAEHASSAVELGLTALRIDVINTLVGAVIGTLVSVVLLFVSYKFGKLAVDIMNCRELDDDDPRKNVLVRHYRLDYEVPNLIGSVVFGVLGTVFLLVNITKLINVWLWAGLFYPELWAVYKTIFS